jgi:hypothetical protein
MRPGGVCCCTRVSVIRACRIRVAWRLPAVVLRASVALPVCDSEDNHLPSEVDVIC